MIAREGSPDPLELLRRAKDVAPPEGAQDRVAALLLAGTAGLGSGPKMAAPGLASAEQTTLRLLTRRFMAWSLLPLAGGIVIGASGEAFLSNRRALQAAPPTKTMASVAAVAPKLIAPADSAPLLTPVPEPVSSASVPTPVKITATELLAQERAVLDRARQRLSADEPAAAQRYLEQHAQRFPTGRLREEREAMLINVLVRLGRFERARAHGAAFKRQYPSSLMLSSVNAALATLGAD